MTENHRVGVRVFPTADIGPDDFANRLHPRAIPRVDSSGVYAIFLNDSVSLPGIQVKTDRPIYVGKAQNLHLRNHFRYRDSGRSTFRRTLGAVLRNALPLKPMPRVDRDADRGCQFYTFGKEGEARLTEWMIENLTYSFLLVPKHLLISTEIALIKHLQPPLNLDEWDNPIGAQISRLRKRCEMDAVRAM